MLNWIKTLIRVVRGYDTQIKTANSRIAALEGLIREHTNIAVDVGFRSANHVIVIGKYKNNDYIQCFSMQERDIGQLIDNLREMSRYGKVARVDSPPVFKACFKWDKGGHDFY